VIDETPRAPDALVSGTQTPLTAPHFDETAVAVAQPVEPLPPQRFRLSNLSLQSFVIIVAFGLVLTITTVATGFLAARSEQAKASEAAAGAVQTEPPAAPSASESTPTAAGVSEEITVPSSVKTEKHSGRSRRMLMRSGSLNGIAPIMTDEQGRPVARKVGELKYGRSPDRP